MFLTFGWLVRIDSRSRLSRLFKLVLTFRHVFLENLHDNFVILSDDVELDGEKPAGDFNLWMILVPAR